MGVKDPYGILLSDAISQDTYIVRAEEKTRFRKHDYYTALKIEPMGINDIPKAMKRMRWMKSAALMTRWLTTPGWECPPAWKSGKELPRGLEIPDQHCDDKIITMSWLLRYPAAVRAVNKLLNERALSPAGLKVTANRLKKLGWDGKGSYTFGRTNLLGRPSMSARELEQYYQNNYLAVGDNAVVHVIVDTLDDIFGALGTYNLKVAVVGTAFRGTNKDVFFEPSYAGVYVKDFYDFNNDGGYDQHLGLWCEEGILTRGQSAYAKFFNMGVTHLKNKHMKAAEVKNSDFLRYREKYGLGGDIIVFSDVYWVKMSGVYKLPWDDI